MNAGEWIALAALAVTIMGGMFGLTFWAGSISRRVGQHEEAIDRAFDEQKGLRSDLAEIRRLLTRQAIIIAQIASKQGIPVDPEELVKAKE